MTALWVSYQRGDGIYGFAVSSVPSLSPRRPRVVQMQLNIDYDSDTIGVSTILLVRFLGCILFLEIEPCLGVVHAMPLVNVCVYICVMCV